MGIQLESRGQPIYRYVYRGVACNLGRFGPVKSGDVLHLDHDEAVFVSGNERFIPWPEGAQKPTGTEPAAPFTSAATAHSTANKNTPPTPPGRK